MKRILFAILALALLLPLTACQSLVETVETPTETATTPAPEPEGEKPLVIPAGNCAGFSRVDITPTSFPVPMSGTSTATSAADKLYATCVAISDGEEVALLFHTDLKRSDDAVFTATANRIKKATGIEADHIFITSTHTHNGPEVNQDSDPKITLWLRTVYYPQMEKAAVEAYRDLSPVRAFGGESDTTGFAFVRRYVLADGTYSGLHYKDSGSPAVRHFSEADSQMQVIKLTREGKKDIVMTNWQCHAAHAASTYRTQLSADFVGILRKGVENEMNVDFAYYTGASGNLNFSTKFSNLIAYGSSTSWQAAGRALVDKVKEAYNNATEELVLGKIQVAQNNFACTIREDDPTRLAQAREVASATGAQKDYLISHYGFHSKYEASSIVSRATYRNQGPTQGVPVGAIVCGEIAFISAGYEMFDTSGMYIKENSPAKMTFICAYTNGSYGYIPDEAAFDSNGYETHCCRYVKGTAEKLADEILRLIRDAE